MRRWIGNRTPSHVEHVYLGMTERFLNKSNLCARYGQDTPQTRFTISDPSIAYIRITLCGDRTIVHGVLRQLKPYVGPVTPEYHVVQLAALIVDRYIRDRC